MSRRFPPPLFGADGIERRSRVFVAIAAGADEPIEKARFVERCRERVRKPDGDRYSSGYVRRVVSTYVQLGVLRRTDEGITVYAFAREWVDGEIDFETFLWYAVKRAWAIEGEFPEGIEGLYHLHRVVQHADEPLARGQLRERLAEEYDYEFNDEGIRGYPALLEALGALERTEAGYVATDPSRFADRFRSADLLWQFEQWLKREGPTADPPPDRVKRDLAKYYTYRECGGHGRHRQLLDTARRNYLDDAAVENDYAEPTLQRSEPYLERSRRRRELRERICERFSDLEPRDLAGLSTDVLERMAGADSEREARAAKAEAGSGLSRADVRRLAGADRAPYSFPEEFELYDWQREAASAWFDGERADPESGIAQVVTGAGKTVMALAVLRRWLDRNPEGAVTVVVPTKVLMRQWLEELVETLNVPADDVGWVGDGHKDGFEDGYRVLVCIVNSAVKDDYLAGTLARAGVDDHLLIADECHRYTGDTFSNVFEYPRTASLGLSATPLSNPGSDERTEADRLLLDELGDVFYELSYDEGLERGLIPEFRVNYVGFDLTDAERTAYETLSEKVADAVKEIEQQYQHRLYELDGSFSQKLQAIKSAADHPTPAIGDFFRYTQQRRELVADAVARQAITLRLLEDVVEDDKKAIVFQERIEQLERMVAPKETRGRNARTGDVADTDVDRAQLYEQYPQLEAVDQALEDLFFQASYRPVMYHSGHRNEAWNDFAVEWFGEDGFANVMLSVKALIEGVDIPSADVGIVRVASGSVRQRIQTLGRVLRTGEGADRSELYVLYARDTVDEDIFEKYDWRDQLGRAEIRHLRWETGEDAVDGELVPGEAPTTPPEVPDAADLEVGQEYPCPEESRAVDVRYEFSVDADGDPFRTVDRTRRFIENDPHRAVAEHVHARKGGGTVKVTAEGHALTYVDDSLLFVGTVPEKDEITYEDPCTLVDSVDDDELL